MNKKSKKSNFLRNLLTTASVASVIVGASNSAFAAAAPRPRVVLGNTVLGTGAGLDQLAAGADDVFVTDSTLQYNGVAGHIVNVNMLGVKIKAIDINAAPNAGAGNAPGIMTISENASIGSITMTNTNAGAAGYTLNMTVVAGKTLTLTGTGGVVAGTAAGVGAADVNIAPNSYDRLGTITFAAGSILNIDPTTRGDIVFTKFAVVDGANATLNVTNPGPNHAITFNNATVATFQTININDGSTVKFETDQTVGGIAGTLTLQDHADRVINFGNKGEGKLLLASNAAQAVSFSVMHGSLGGTKAVVGDRHEPRDDYGIIHFDTTNAGAGVAATLSAGAAADRKTVIGHDEKHRAKEFKVVSDAAHPATVIGKVYSKKIELTGAGAITFTNEVSVGKGKDGSTDIQNATIDFAEGANLGKVDFKGTDGVIKVAVGKTLKGDFVGNRAANSKEIKGKIEFAGGGGTLKGNIDRMVEIKITGPGNLTLSGDHKVNDLQGADAASHFIFEDGYKLTGNITATATSNLTFLGDAEITGKIGNVDIRAVADAVDNNAAAVAAVAAANVGKVGNLAIKKGKTVTVKDGSIFATQIFDVADGGTLSLVTDKSDVVVVSPRISEAGGSTIKVSGSADKKVMIIANIGTDPAVANSKHLDKIVLNGQNLILVPITTPAVPAVPPVAAKSAVPGFVNVAGIDFNKKASVVRLGIDDCNYALGDLKDAENAVIEIGQTINLYNTKTAQGDQLKEIRFVGDRALILHKDNNIAAKEITVGASGKGAIIFAGDSTLKGDIGKPTNKLKGIVVDSDVTASTSGKAYLEGDVTLYGRSVLNVDNNYDVARVGGAAAGEGTLRFVNKDPVILKTAHVVAAPAAVDGVVPAPAADTVYATHAIDTLELNGGNVALVNNGISFGKISFTGKDTILTLDKNMQLMGIDVQSSATGTPTIRLASEKKDEIIATQSIGDASHFVNLQFSKDTTLNVKSQKAFVAITTTKNNEGVVRFDVGTGNKSQVYGLGSDTLKLKEAHFVTSVENRGDTYVGKAVVYDNTTYTAGGTISGDILQIGSNTGHATAALADKVVLKSAVISAGTDNTIDFAGNAEVGNIGTSGNAFKMMKFAGDKTTYATLKGDSIYSEKVNFGSENIKVANSKVLISGSSDIDAEIDLDSNKLALKEGGTWGVNTRIRTRLTQDGTLGCIELGNTVNVAGNVPVDVIGLHVDDEASLKDYRGASFTLIDGAKHVVLHNGKIDLVGNLVTTNRAYTKWVVAVRDGKYVITRDVNEIEGMENDLKKYANDPIDIQNSKLLAAGTPGSDASKTVDDLSHITDDAKRNEFMERLFNTEASQVTQEASRTFGHVIGALGKRMDATKDKAVGAGSDDGTSMGAWVMPYYGQAAQKKDKNGVVGYTSRSVGGIVGFDTLVNDTLTIGAAVSIIESNLKFKDYKTGEKTKIFNLMGSIYGSQQFDKDFFVQAVASFGSSKVDNSDPRITSSGQEVAKASYDSTSYGGELLFGYNAKVADSALITPTVGIRYTRFGDLNYKETGAKTQNKTVSGKANNIVEAIVGARVSTTMDSSGVAITPEVHAFVLQKLGSKLEKVDAKLEGMPTPFVARSDKSAKTLYNVGLGISAKAGAIEYGAGYDAYLATKYIGHQGTLKLRVNF